MFEQTMWLMLNTAFLLESRILVHGGTEYLYDQPPVKILGAKSLGLLYNITDMLLHFTVL